MFIASLIESPPKTPMWQRQYPVGEFRYGQFARYLVSLGNGVANCVWLAVPQATEWQHIGDQIDAAMIFARMDFVSVHGMYSG